MPLSGRLTRWIHHPLLNLYPCQHLTGNRHGIQCWCTQIRFPILLCFSHMLALLSIALDGRNNRHECTFQVIPNRVNIDFLNAPSPTVPPFSSRFPSTSNCTFLPNCGSKSWRTCAPIFPPRIRERARSLKRRRGRSQRVGRDWTLLWLQGAGIHASHASLTKRYGEFMCQLEATRGGALVGFQNGWKGWVQPLISSPQPPIPPDWR